MSLKFSDTTNSDQYLLKDSANELVRSLVVGFLTLYRSTFSRSGNPPFFERRYSYILSIYKILSLIYVFCYQSPIKGVYWFFNIPSSRLLHFIPVLSLNILPYFLRVTDRHKQHSTLSFCYFFLNRHTKLY